MVLKRDDILDLICEERCEQDRAALSMIPDEELPVYFDNVRTLREEGNPFPYSTALVDLLKKKLSKIPDEDE